MPKNCKNHKRNKKRNQFKVQAKVGRGLENREKERNRKSKKNRKKIENSKEDKDRKGEGEINQGALIVEVDQAGLEVIVATIGEEQGIIVTQGDKIYKNL